MPEPEPSPAPHLTRGFPRQEAAYSFCAALFVVTLVLTNVIGTKLFTVFGQTLTTGIITYPITFLLTDLVSEIWGRRRANAMVWWGFGMSLLMLLTLQMAVHLPPSPWWTQSAFGFETAEATQRAYHATFANPSVLLGASMAAYLVAQLFDVRLYHFWWKRTGGKHLWLRNNGSTWISQLVDTTIVNGIFLRFGAGFGPENGWDWDRIGQVILTVYLFKLVLALIDTPLIYAARFGAERLLRIPHDARRPHAPLE